MSDLEFHLQGSQADATAAALERFFAETFGANARREVLQAPAAGEGEKAVDPVAVAALILSIPGALLAAMDLAERLQLKEKVANLIALARRERTEHGTRVWLQRRDAPPLALDEAQPAEIIDAAEKARQP